MILIAGGPKTGKTTLSRGYTDRRIIHTDDFTGRWENRLEQTQRYFNPEDNSVLEGVTVAAALDLWLRSHEGIPAQELIILMHPYLQLNSAQMAMKKGIETILTRINAQLMQRGTSVKWRSGAI